LGSVTGNTKMASQSFNSFGISENILNGIHPNKDENKKQTNESGSQSTHGIPEDILDGIHPKIQSYQKTTKDAKNKNNFFI